MGYALLNNDNNDYKKSRFIFILCVKCIKKSPSIIREKERVNTFSCFFKSKFNQESWEVGSLVCIHKWIRILGRQSKRMDSSVDSCMDWWDILLWCIYDKGSWTGQIPHQEVYMRIQSVFTFNSNVLTMKRVVGKKHHSSGQFLDMGRQCSQWHRCCWLHWVPPDSVWWSPVEEQKRVAVATKLKWETWMQLRWEWIGVKGHRKRIWMA